MNNREKNCTIIPNFRKKSRNIWRYWSYRMALTHTFALFDSNSVNSLWTLFFCKLWHVQSTTFPDLLNSFPFQQSTLYFEFCPGYALSTLLFHLYVTPSKSWAYLMPMAAWTGPYQTRPKIIAKASGGHVAENPLAWQYGLTKSHSSTIGLNVLNNSPQWKSIQNASSKSSLLLISRNRCLPSFSHKNYSCTSCGYGSWKIHISLIGAVVLPRFLRYFWDRGHSALKVCHLDCSLQMNAVHSISQWCLFLLYDFSICACQNCFLTFWRYSAQGWWSM